MDDFGYYRCEGFDVGGTLGKIKRSSDCLAPVFEALSNSLDAVSELEGAGRSVSTVPIRITFDFNSMFEDGSSKRLSSITIQDGGSGFTRENYARFLSLNDRSKGPFNKGSGRVQFIKSFALADFESVFFDADGSLKKRRFSLSGAREYLKRNAFARATSAVENAVVGKDAPGTTLRLLSPFTDAKTREIEESTASDVKGRVLSRFFLRLNTSRKAPPIEIVFCVNGVEQERATVDASDTVAPRAVVPFEVGYKRLSTFGSSRRFARVDKVAKFTAVVFTPLGSFFTRNVEAFVSRGEVVEEARLGLANADEKVGDFYYAVAITGDYIDERVDESRDGSGLISDRDFESAPLFGDDASGVSVEDVRKAARAACASALPELASKKKELARKVEGVGARFGFSKRATDAVQNRLPLNASSKEILKRLYDKEASSSARDDDAIFNVLESVKELDPTSETYQEASRELTSRLFGLIPEQNRNALSHYFARRKIVLETLGDALERSLKIQTEGVRRQEESVLHNLLFKRGSRDASSSDLWILNEEFVYFSGAPEVAFEDVEFEGKKILAPLDEFSKEDGKFIRSKAKNRPDILLFPEERKCLIVELKKPGVDVAEHVHQIYRYAYVLFNYCSPEFKFDQFYAFLIGGEIDAEGIRAVDPSYQEAKKFGYMFATRPIASRVPTRPDGELYAEIHSYRTILERAKVRNKTFLDLLLNVE